MRALYFYFKSSPGIDGQTGSVLSTNIPQCLLVTPYKTSHQRICLYRQNLYKLLYIISLADSWAIHFKHCRYTTMISGYTTIIFLTVFDIEIKFVICFLLLCRRKASKMRATVERNNLLKNSNDCYLITNKFKCT